MIANYYPCLINYSVYYMKRTSIYYFSLAAILAGSLASCQDDDMGYTSEEIAYAKFEKEYNENFVRDYGQIAPGHTWGFDDKVGTRAVQDASCQYRIVRNADGTVSSADKNIEPIIGGQKNDANCKYAYVNCPPAITEAEKKYVFKYLADHPNQGSTTCDLDNYFLQNLGQYVEHEYTTTEDRNHNIHKVKNTNNMNQLTFDDVHFQSYNASIGYDYYVTNTEIRDPQYHDNYGSSFILTEDSYRFYYIPGNMHTGIYIKNAQGEDEEYVFQGGSYLCFDYITTNKDDQSKYLGDGYYDDWVIKVCPGEGDLWRVFCEDLGSTFDLDFNDLVFDYCDYGNNLTSIKVLALEGTLPIFIDGKDLKGGDLTAHHNVDMPVFFIDKPVEGTNNLISVKRDPNNGNSMEHGTCFIANGKDRAPYLLRVKPGVDWPAENQRIERKYPEFTKYVSAPTVQPNWWGDL